MSTTAPQGQVYLAEAVSFEAAGRRIIDGVDFVLRPDRVTGLVGPNGSGKSTLMKLLARQQPVSSGTIRLKGRELASFGDREFARTVAYLPQFTPLAEGLTVRELVGLGRFPWHGPLGRFSAEDEAKVDQALEQAGLTSFASRLVDRMSGGERQRAWLAMMLAQEAGCLLLDEPTSALDIGHQVEMLGLMSELSRHGGHTVMIVLHDINMAARFCDEIVAMRDGRIVASGTPAEIVSPDALERIYDLPMGTLPHPVTGAPISYLR